MKTNDTLLVETNNRYAALEWWNNLPFDSSNTNKSKKHYYDNYKANVYTVAKDYTELTGREIQNIWAVETYKGTPIVEDVSMEDAAKTHSIRVWGEYRYDIFEHNDIITDKSLGEISQSDFNAGWQQREQQLLPIIKELGEALVYVKSFIPKKVYGQGESYDSEVYTQIQTTLEKYKQYL